MANRIKIFRPYIISGTAITPLFFSALFASPAVADGTSMTQPSGGLDEVVVTAQKRSERLQDVPIAVTALSADALEIRGITSTADLQFVTPGLSWQESSHAAVARIRGVGSTISSGGNENSVATVIDGVYYAAADSATMNFNNIDQVEVLKGPQGTLFGRNATGGVIQITTRDPSEDYAGSANVTYGNVNTIGTNAYVTGGIMTGISADVAIQLRNQYDGFGRNLYNGDYFGTSRDWAIRSKWKLDLGDNTTARVIFDYDSFISTLNGYRPVSGALPATGVPYTGKPFDIDSFYQPLGDEFSGGVSLQLDHQFDGMELVSISSYRRTDYIGHLNTGIAPVPLLGTNYVGPGNQQSQEIHLKSTDNNRINWSAGLFYFRYVGGWENVSVFSSPTFLNFDEELHSRQTTQSYAGYMQASYKVSDRTQVTLGLRLTEETKDFSGAGTYTVTNPGYGFPLGPVSASSSLFKPTWRVALDHHIDDDLMTYVSYNRGFKSGGFDATAVAAVSKIQPEQLDAFEVGAKDELFGHRLRVDAAAYYYDYKEIQLSDFVGGLPAIYNGQSATLYGLDLDATAQLTSGLNATLALGLIHSAFGDFPISNTLQLAGGGVDVSTDISAKGKQIPDAPAATFDFGVTYNIPITKGSIDVAADYFWSDSFYAFPDNKEQQKAYSIVNASVAWLFGKNESYSARLWGKNLGNSVYANQLFPQTSGYTIEVAPGRTFGLTLGCKF